MAVQIQIRRDSAADWISNNPTLADGEIGYEIDTQKIKIGSGSLAWNSLPYFIESGSSNPTTSISGLISGSSQLTGSYDERYVLDSSYQVDSASFDSRIVGISASGSGADWNVNLSNIPSGLISGSSQLTSSFDSRYELSGSTVALPQGLISGSSQVDYTGLSNIPSGVVSGSSQVDYSGLSNIPSGLISGSEQLPSGVVSGSSQVDYTGLSNIPSGLVSGSSQLTGSYDVRYTLSGSVQALPSGLFSGSSQVSYTGLSNIPSGVVSGSSQVDYVGLSNIPSGIISGSSQVSYSGVSGIPSGIISGSSQVTASLDTRYELSGSAQPLPSGLVSGSSQVDYTGLSNIPSGIISGSSQLPSGLVSGSDQLSGSFVSLNTNQVISGVKSQAPIALTSSAGSINWSGSEGNVYTVTLTEDVTLQEPSDPISGTFYTFIFTQDENGPWSLSFPSGSSIKTPGGLQPNIALDAASVSLVTGYYDGTNLLTNTVADFR